MSQYETVALKRGVGNLGGESMGKKINAKRSTKKIFFVVIKLHDVTFRKMVMSVVTAVSRISQNIENSLLFTFYVV
jgi:hypothetical protein